MPNIFKMSNAGGFKSLTRYWNMLTNNTTWNPYTPEGSFYEIAKYTAPSGGVASVTFTVPSGYRHLQIQGTIKAEYDWQFRYNNDSGSNYTRHLLYGSGSGSATAAAYLNTSSAYIGYGSSPTNWGSFIVNIYDYASNAKNKTHRSLMGFDNNGSGFIMQNSSVWLNTAPITSVTIIPQGTIQEFSTFTLIGIK